MRGLLIILSFRVNPSLITNVLSEVNSGSGGFSLRSFCWKPRPSTLGVGIFRVEGLGIFRVSGFGISFLPLQVVGRE